MTPLEHALAYAARGLRVAPVAPGTKWPRIDQWQIKATTDPAVVTTWWRRFPDDGVSIVTGEASGCFVVDVDPRHDGDETLAELERIHGPLPDTVEALTGGGGRHLYLAMPDGAPYPRNDQTGIALGAGVDIRGDGGQVVAPPSVHPDTGRTYEWEVEHSLLDGVMIAVAPAWLVGLLTAERPPRKPRTQRGAQDGDRPGDIFERSCAWPELLEPAGWQLHSVHAHGGGYELWTRPGKDPRHGASASLYYQGSDVLKVFTTSAAPLEAGRTYDRWGFHVAMTQGSTSDTAIAAASSLYRKALNAAGGSDFPPRDEVPENRPADIPPQRPAITVNNRHLDEVAADAVTALAAANDPPALFVRSGALVRLRADEHGRPLIDSLRSEHVRLHLAEAATWWRSRKDDGPVKVSPPLDVAATVLAARDWPVPGLAGVVELPVLRPDGSFHAGHGYDEPTKLYHWHQRGISYPAIPQAPSAEQLAAAVALVDETLCDFPWDTTSDRANAWGLLLTPLVRPIVGQVPMALVDAPEPGTGKGLLVEIASILASGRPGALMAWPSSDEELEKKVTAALMAGNTLMVFDNVEGMIRSPTLAAVLTSSTWQGRVLGRSEMVAIPNRATWVATGNNIDVGGDLARRCYRIRLDAHTATPWKRTGFRHPDLRDWVTERRGELLGALCTIVASWWAAGRPLAEGIAAMGGYTAWVRTVGGICDHAGVDGFLANLDDFHAQADREAQQWEALLTTWHSEYGEGGYTVAELIQVMASGSTSGDDLRATVPEDLSGYWDTPGFSRRLSLALRKRVGRHYGNDGLHLVELPRDRRNVAIYSVTNRPVQLFETAEAHTKPKHYDASSLSQAEAASAEQAAEAAQLPRGANEVAGETPPSAGVKGVAPLPESSKTYPQGPLETQGRGGRQTPATPNSRADDESMWPD